METLNTYMIDNGITQKEFADAIGITQATVSRICAGKLRPSSTVMVKIATQTKGQVPILSWFESFGDIA